MGAIVRWADGHLEAPRIGCLIAPENAPSLRVAHKLGFRDIDRILLQGAPVVLLHRPRPQAASGAVSE